MRNKIRTGDGELGASLRYLSQRYSMPYAELKGLLTDIGTEELARTLLEIERLWNNGTFKIPYVYKENRYSMWKKSSLIGIDFLEDF